MIDESPLTYQQKLLKRLDEREELMAATAAVLRDLMAAEKWHLDRIAELEFQVKEYVEQAEEGVKVMHDCPAVFACSFIIADSSGKENEAK